MSVTAAKGFVAGGVACGIKDSGAPDLALVATESRTPVPAAGVFTTNLVAAAPVQVSRVHLADGHAAAVVLNSGNANAATGQPGRLVSEQTCSLVAHELGVHLDDVLICSTGLIGISLAIEPFESGVAPLVGALATGEAAGQAAAQAIMTTDTMRKEAQASFFARHKCEAVVGGMAKGAAMLAPSMATMLAVLTTDAAATPRALHAALERAVDASFNQLSVDGCRSTNDTVLILASGVAGNDAVDAGGAGFHGLVDAVTEVCTSLAEQMAADAEGATKRVRVYVKGARSKEDARRAARTVADSALVKCSLYGEDPYWGRVLSELGVSGANFDPERVTIAYNGHVVCDDGVAAPHDPAAVKAAMKEREITITCDLRCGMGEATILTTDLSHAYIDENMRTS
jgi:glutamate N-acetyltransferase/amino-acid N-acetyltransferase